MMKYILTATNRLSELRESKGYSKSELAHYTGTTENTIEKIECGDYISNILLCLEISTILECKVDDIWYLRELIV